MGRSIVVHHDAEDLAKAMAQRLIDRLTELQRQGRAPEVALTGGRIASAVYQRLAAEASRSTLDWSQVGLWWGDERFVPSGDEDRNDRQALAALGQLDLDPARVHQMPASDSGLELDAAAASYAAELGELEFDICLLGMGPDGHVASIFPDHPSAQEPGSVIAVRSSPKPPPERISLTLEVINRSREVWFCVSGEDKAAALKLALEGTNREQLPAAGVAGTSRTVWLVDTAAAAQLVDGIVGDQ